MRTHHLRAAILVALSASSGIAAAACQLQGPGVLFCPTPALLARAWPIAANWSFDAQARDPAALLGCTRIHGKSEKATIIEERTWHAKGGTAVMVHLDLGGTAKVTRDAYSAEGEYLGKRTESITNGWLLKKEIVCDASSNRASGSSTAP